MNLFGVGAKSTPFLVFLIAAAIVALGWYSGLFKSLFKQPAPESQQEPSVTINGVDFKPLSQLPVYFEEGAPLPAAFPAELILNEDAAPVNVAIFSERDETNANTEMVKWDSSSSMETFFVAYKNYFAANGWEIRYEDTEVADARLLEAVKDLSRAKITITSLGSGAGVVVEYTVINKN